MARCREQGGVQGADGGLGQDQPDGHRKVQVDGWWWFRSLLGSNGCKVYRERESSGLVRYHKQVQLWIDCILTSLSLMEKTMSECILIQSEPDCSF